MTSLVILSLIFLLLQRPLSSLSNSEGDALTDFKERLSDPNNVMQSWDPTLDNPCTWYHVMCDSTDHVFRIDMARTSLSGTLGPELGQLHNLKYLELYGNSLNGNIPEELGNLENVISIDLYDNQLEGNIPKSFGNLKSLQFLRLNDNNLSGTIPIEIIRLNLQIFNYSNTHLSKP